MTGCGAHMANDIQISLSSAEGSVHFQENLPEAGATLAVWCTICGKSFLWVAPNDGNVPPHYCSKACRNRNKRRKKYGETLRCPTPDKRRYLAPEKAVEGAARANEQYGSGATPYLCQCGVYHLGHATWAVLDG